jgi:hypothetical protein
MALGASLYPHLADFFQTLCAEVPIGSFGWKGFYAIVVPLELVGKNNLSFLHNPLTQNIVPCQRFLLSMLGFDWKVAEIAIKSR